MTSPHHPAPSAVNEALVPVPAERRVFQWHDHASLWFSLGVGLLVMQVGAYLMPALALPGAGMAVAGRLPCARMISGLSLGDWGAIRFKGTLSACGLRCRHP